MSLTYRQCQQSFLAEENDHLTKAVSDQKERLKEQWAKMAEAAKTEHALRSELSELVSKLDLIRLES